MTRYFIFFVMTSSHLFNKMIPGNLRAPSFQTMNEMRLKFARDIVFQKNTRRIPNKIQQGSNSKIKSF